MNALPKSLSYVGRRDEYLPGSRSDDIQIIADWLEDPDQVVFWMRGGAGLGKSTLAHKIVDSLWADDHLATFAFLLHGSSSHPASHPINGKGIGCVASTSYPTGSNGSAHM